MFILKKNRDSKYIVELHTTEYHCEQKFVAIFDLFALPENIVDELNEKCEIKINMEIVK